MSQYTLKFTKVKSKLVYNTEDTGIVCLEESPVPSYESKGLYEVDWPDENGVDVYDQGDIMLKASDITIPMGVSGDDCVSKYSSFIQWLTTNGSLMDVEYPHIGKTLRNVVFSKADPDNYSPSGILTFKLTLRITSPNL